MEQVQSATMMHRLAHAMPHPVATAATVRARTGDEAAPVASDFVATLDADASGDLTAAELEGTALGEIVSGDTWDAVDADGDGAISPDELAERHGDYLTWRAGIRSSLAEARSMVMAAAQDI